MPKETVLLVDSDGDCEEAVATAAAQSGCRVQWIRTAGDVFRSLCPRLDEFALVVIDIDAGSRGMALLEAISACANTPPIITLTGFEEIYVDAIARAHGAVACLGKPIAGQELASTFRKVLSAHTASSDRWGHMMPARIENGRRKKRACRGIAQKLSPIVQTELRRNDNG